MDHLKKQLKSALKRYINPYASFACVVNGTGISNFSLQCKVFKIS